MKKPTLEKQKQTRAVVEAACAELDKFNQSVDELMEFLEREDKLPVRREARKTMKFVILVLTHLQSHPVYLENEITIGCMQQRSVLKRKLAA